MPKYLVEVEGTNFLIELEGVRSKHGFFTVRSVEVDDVTAAELQAIERIRTLPRLRELVLNPPDDPPVMHVRSILEVTSFDENEEPEPGLVWYSVQPKRWWQFWKR